MRLKYKAIKQNGEVYSEVVDSKDKLTLGDEIKSKGDTVIFIEKADSKLQIIKDYISNFGSVGIRDKILFARNLGVMIRSGLSQSRSLSILLKQTKNPKLKNILTQIDLDIKKGKSLSASISNYPKVFPEIFVAMTRAGEETGGLAQALKTVSQEMDQTYQMEKKFKGAMVYPIFVMSLMIIIGVLMMIFVVPSLTSTFKDLGTELPFMTSLIISISDFLTENLLLVLVIVMILGVCLFSFKKSPIGKRFFDYIYLKLPAIGEIIRGSNSARTARTMSSLLTAGVPVVSALKITCDVVQNSYFRDVLVKANESVQKGIAISEVIGENENLYPPFVTEMVNVGEETGSLPQMFSEIADFYEDEVSQKMKNISTIIEPVLMAIIGVAVGLFAFAMISPTYSLMSNL